MLSSGSKERLICDFRGVNSLSKGKNEPLNRDKFLILKEILRPDPKFVNWNLAVGPMIGGDEGQFSDVRHDLRIDSVDGVAGLVIGQMRSGGSY